MLREGLFVYVIVDKMKSQHHADLLLLIVTIVLIAPAGTKHIAVTLDAKWKSTPLLLEAW